MSDNLVELKNIEKSFPIHSGIFGRTKERVQAVRDLTLSIGRGETLGLVGESGCGKSTLAMLILRLLQPDAGRIDFDGQDITNMSQGRLRSLRRKMQLVFQDPYGSLNPRMRAGDIIAEPIIVHEKAKKGERHERVVRLLEMVGLGADAYRKYPHEFSGGQRQRIGIARAIALHPKLVIADEPVSALDVSIRGEILNLLDDLRGEFSLTYLFIAHDLNVVEHVSDRIAVMYLGKLMELFPAAELSEARHPYTQALVSAIPIPNPAFKKKRIVLEGDVPSPIDPPKGCPFHPRCPYAKEICASEEPPFAEYRSGFTASCHFIGDMGGHTVGSMERNNKS